jgi:tetracycline 7-halogenase / FADH2 O2-dependent halogenase
MIREQANVAVLGAGFAGSLMALVLQRIGRTVLLVERGQHPRFAIGESSTPLGNLVLEELSRDYDLPRLFPLTAYGRWRQTYPQLPVGLKRGFTFFQHQAGEAFQPTPDHANELLVTANPEDAVADTHWFRETFDHFLVREAQSAGVPYYDRTEVTAIERGKDWLLRGSRDGEAVELRASFLIDASGPGGILARSMNIDSSPAEVRTSSWSVFSHFEGVDLFENILAEAGGNVADHPYHCDDAAVHHLLEDGWIWVLPFKNGVTSAGVLLDCARRPPDHSGPPQGEWERTLLRYPSIGRQFVRARAVQPWVRTGRAQRRARRAAGDSWAMLSHAAYFLDALFSGGNSHSLITIQRLARILDQNWGKSSLPLQLADYETRLLREADFLDRLIHGCYRTFGSFELFAAYVMYYFAGAIQSEERRRQGKTSPDEGFLFSHHPPFYSAVCRAHDGLVTPPSPTPAAFQSQVALDIALYNPAGLCDPARKNMYPFI